MLYFSILGVLIILLFVENRNEIKKIFFFFYCILFFLSIFRFGLGTDYFNYYILYESFPFNSFSDFSFKRYVVYGIEPIYCLLEALFKFFKSPFELFISFCSFLSLLCVYKAFMKLSKSFVFTIFIFFTNYFLIAIWSMVRQGVAMSIFLYALTDLLINKNRKKYFLLIFIACGFHFSAFICFFVPLVLRFPKKIFTNYKYIVLFTILSICVGFILPKIIILLVSMIFPRYASYTSDGYNILGIGLRLLELTLIVSLRNKIKNDEVDKNIYKLFVFGLYISFMCMTISVLTRLTEYFLFLEIILIPNAVVKLTKYNRRIYICLFILLYSFLFFKDIRSFSQQGSFISCTKVYEYPYVSVFNKNKIKAIRPNYSLYGYFD